MVHRYTAAFVLLLATASALALPFWGAKESRPDGTPPGALKPGEFVWAPGVAPDGPIVVIVSLTEQRAYVYRNGVEIGYTTVSTGKPGHVTPTGNFTILQKDKAVTSKMEAVRSTMRIIVAALDNTRDDFRYTISDFRKLLG